MVGYHILKFFYIQLDQFFFLRKIFFGIYLLAQLAGIISNVPGGLGVFETILILLLSPPIPSASLLGALLAYRGIYYFLPLGVSILMLLWYEFKQRRTRNAINTQN